ncbi:TIGR01777 family oxidoreductase [Sphingobacterium bambusae]|uniref:TIGR01777 family oxidoreductase n=1 Tax=Sphingobacterium bambusae TaxID=662858 RepID=A0ABW6BEP3_9SPHI|nr:TIGR01777 family oxidoreductase [Sphingobacterium bambusae]WPL47092.1 TIGR01777 family oxidoreductase [Sphingobacterium bambusae]
MEYNKIVLAGGNGYLGGVLANYYSSRAKEVVILARKDKAPNGNIKTVLWDGCTAGAWEGQLNGADLLINLCGKNVNCSYTESNKAKIIRSRVIPTALLGEAVAKLENPPKLWINVTSATIYRHAEDRSQDEENGEIGQGFSVDVCRRWEEVFFETDTPHTRKIALRMGIVLGHSGGAFPRLLNLARCGLGGKQGNGQQYVSWIHEQDAAACTEWLMKQEQMEGPINAVAPEPVKNVQFMDMLRRAYQIPFGLPSPAWLLEIGAKLIGTETELILKSRWVMPKRLMDGGYPFLYSQTAHALQDLRNIKN